MASIDVPHLRWPLRLTAGPDLPGQVGHAPIQQVEQDTLAEVQQAIRLLLNTAPGDRPLAPDVGVEEFAFTVNGVDPELLAARLEEFEDRASVTVTVSPPDGSGHQDVQIAVALANPEDRAA